MEQLAFILKREIAKTINKVGLEKDQIIAALQNTEIAKRVIKHNEQLNYINTTKKPITSSQLSRCVTDIEWLEN